MSRKKPRSAEDLRKIRYMCRQMGKTRGRVSRKYSWEYFPEIKGSVSPMTESVTPISEIKETLKKHVQK